MSLVDGLYEKVPLNTTEMPQAVLNIESKFRSNPFPWNGQFSPQLIHALLDQYGDQDSTVLDPFLGSGTVLLEAGRIGLKAFGTEINPAAIAFSDVYQFINVYLEQREALVAETRILLEDELADALPLFQTSAALKMKLVRISTSIVGLQRTLIDALIVMLDFDKPILDLNRVLCVWDDLAETVLGLPYSDNPVTALNSDGRRIPLRDSAVTVVVTSPPYINVFNYHQRFRASMEALEWNLLEVAKSEFGANRKHRGNRFLTVVQFCLDMAQVFEELKRVCTRDARLIFVVGRESMVRGTRFFNGEVVTEVAHRVLGFELTLRQERVFVNRYGRNIYEDILHFTPPSRTGCNAILAEARGVAQLVLETAYPTAPEGSRADLQSALANIHEVRPSQLFNRELAYGGSAPNQQPVSAIGA